MTPNDILIDTFGRVHGELPRQLDGLSMLGLTWRPDGDANPIGWLAWHLTRVQDDHLAGLVDAEQVWTRDGFADRFALPYPVEAIGYGQHRDEVDAFVVDEPQPLIEYHDAVHRRTVEIVSGLDAAQFERVVDRHWDPPVTAAVRLVSVVNDITQHLGQISYVRGLWDRRAA